MSISVANINLFLLVFMRMSGMILFNPLLGRDNVPTLLKAALSLIVSFLIVPTLHTAVSVSGPTQLVVSCLPELFIGYGMGVLIAGLFSVFQVAGEAIDLQMGFSMANFYDPKSQISMPIVGSYLNAVLVLVFFAGNAHLALFQMIADSFKAVPAGTVFVTEKSCWFVVAMGKDIFELGLRMALPILVVELVVQVVNGILMRTVPQIDIFSVGIQIQTLAGLAMLLVMTTVFVALSGRLTDYTIEKCAEFIKLLTHT